MPPKALESPRRPEPLVYEVHVHLHVHDADTSKKIDTLLAQFSAFREQERLVMTDVTNVKQLITDMKNETDALGARVEAKQTEQTAAIQALKDQIAAGTAVTQADLDGLGVDLTDEIARLKVIGADPANPIPAA